MRIDPKTIENVSKELYIRALKILPPDVKRGFDTLAAKETSSTAQNVLGTMIKNISIAEATENLQWGEDLCFKVRRRRRHCAQGGDTQGLRARDA